MVASAAVPLFWPWQPLVNRSHVGTPWRAALPSHPLHTNRCTHAGGKHGKGHAVLHGGRPRHKHEVKRGAARHQHGVQRHAVEGLWWVMVRAQI